MGQGPIAIEIKGARTHQLRAIDVNLPLGQLSVIAGVSGSGKSSLAFDTLFVEGQRRYLECLGPFARRVLDAWPPPDVDDIAGLPPTLAVSQRDRLVGGARSLVATATELADYLRLLYARCGDVHCPRCGNPLGRQSLERIVESVLSAPEGERIHILAPLVRGKRGEHKEAFLFLKREGFVRARVDGAVTLVDGPLPLDPSREHDIEMVVDRQVIRTGLRERLTDSLRTALKHGSGTVIIAGERDGEWVDRLYSTRDVCLQCDVSYPPLEPRSFSFNSPAGACPTCDGLGTVTERSLDDIVDAPDRSMAEGASLLGRQKNGKPSASLRRVLEAWAEGTDWLTTPFARLSSDARASLWEGGDHHQGLRELAQEWEALVEQDAEPPEWVRGRAIRCPACDGQRLAPLPRSVTIADVNLPGLLTQSIADVANWVKTLDFHAEQRPIADVIVRELEPRLSFLCDVGLSYVELDRPTDSLSGGEAQRMRLASCIGASLEGVCYVLDEPTRGLHARDTGRLLTLLEQLRKRGNTLVVVEHDEDMLRRADFLVELGPGAGREGGAIINQGNGPTFLSGPGLTADYLTGRRSIRDLPAPRESRSPIGVVTLVGANEHHLKDITVSFPLGEFVAVSGVSGSGKSTLVMDVLAPALRRLLGKSAESPGRHARVEISGELVDVVVVDQTPIGRTLRSTPASHAGLLDPLRDVFARTREAKARGYPASRFSYNTAAGRCPECKGLGGRSLEDVGMPTVYFPCPLCQGSRFERGALEVTFKGRSIADYLAMTIDEAADALLDHPRIGPILSVLREVGLGYLTLGQSAPTLSGGEAQRLKLGTALARERAGPTLYILDEPTAGLHFHDIAQLLRLWRRLVDRGDTVLIIEHHLEVLAAADWIIDLGPEGGAEGGYLLFEGTPAEFAKETGNATGLALSRRSKATAH